MVIQERKRCQEFSCPKGKKTGESVVVQEHKNEIAEEE